jgi:Amt family ammonium transporter
VHGIGGIVGSLLTGLLASKTISGVEGSVVTQLVGVVAVMVYSAAVSAALLLLLKYTVGLRVDERSEFAGLDISQHRERMGS